MGSGEFQTGAFHSMTLWLPAPPFGKLNTDFVAPRKLPVVDLFLATWIFIDAMNPAGVFDSDLPPAALVCLFLQQILLDDVGQDALHLRQLELGGRWLFRIFVNVSLQYFAMLLTAGGAFSTGPRILLYELQICLRDIFCLADILDEMYFGMKWVFQKMH